MSHSLQRDFGFVTNKMIPVWAGTRNRTRSRTSRRPSSTSHWLNWDFRNGTSCNSTCMRDSLLTLLIHDSIFVLACGARPKVHCASWVRVRVNTNSSLNANCGVTASSWVYSPVLSICIYVFALRHPKLFKSNMLTLHCSTISLLPNQSI